MLIRVGFEQGAVSKWVAKLDFAEATRQQRVLCRWLMQHGALYFSSQAEHDRFWHDVRSAGPSGSQVSSVWLAGMQALKDSRWRVTEGPIDLRLASPSSRIGAHQRESPERSRIDGFHNSETYQRMNQRVAAGRVSARSARDEVWHMWLAPLADHFRTITIYDPYLGRQYLDGGERATRNGVAACRWLVTHLADTALDHTLRILTLAPQSTKQQVNDICDAMRASFDALLAGKPNLTIELVVAARQGQRGALARARLRDRDLHDRYIRFSGGSGMEAAIVVAAGFDRLGEDPLPVDVHLQYRPEFEGVELVSISDLRDGEQALLGAAPMRRTEIVAR